MSVTEYPKVPRILPVSGTFYQTEMEKKIERMGEKRQRGKNHGKKIDWILNERTDAWMQIGSF